MTTPKGKFISIEGVEGAGKSTARQFIQDYLENAHISLVATREPGGTEIAEEIRKVLLYPATAEKIQPKTELLLMFASRAQLVTQVILPALYSGKWVLSDRYVDASYAYQGGGREIPEADIHALDKMIVGPHYPNLTLLLDVPVEIGLKRTEARGSVKDRIEHERVEFFTRVREAYLARAKQDPERIKIIDASRDTISVNSQIASILDEFMVSVTS